MRKKSRMTDFCLKQQIELPLTEVGLAGGRKELHRSLGLALIHGRHGSERGEKHPKSRAWRRGPNWRCRLFRI